MKNKQKAIAQGRRCSGAVEVSQHKKTLTASYFPDQWSRPGLSPLQTGVFPEDERCPGVLALSQRKGRRAISTSERDALTVGTLLQSTAISTGRQEEVEHACMDKKMNTNNISTSP